MDETNDTVREQWAEDVRSMLRRLLTEKQYRRLYMVKGEELSGRHAAKAEGVTLRAVQKSVEQAMNRLAPKKVIATQWDLTPRPRPCPRNGVLLLHWLFPPEAPHEDESEGSNLSTIYDEAHELAAIFGYDDPEDADQLDWSEDGETDPCWGARIVNADAPNRAPRWESEQVAPRKSTVEARADGWIAFNEGEQENPFRGKDEKLARAWARGWQEATEAAATVGIEEGVVTVPLYERVPHAVQAGHRSGRPHVRDSTDVLACRVS